MKAGTKNVILISTCVGAVGIGLGVIIGWFSHSAEPSWVPLVETQLRDLDEANVAKYIDGVQTAQIRSNLQYLAGEPHMATSEGDVALAKYIDAKWKEQLDESEIVTRTYLMSFPDPNNVNLVMVHNADDSMNMTAKTTEDVYEELMESPEKIVQYYSAFAPAGEVTGPLVYANYGSMEDFEYLVSQGVNLTGTIALTKYGRVGRGTRTIYAKHFGVIGVLVYSDPETYLFNGDQGYPNDFSLPPTGVQRGSTMSEFGDPSTPGYPSIKSAYRLPIEDNPYFPVLPLQPIAYEDAEKLIQLLNSATTVPTTDWTTGLNDKKLNIGPGFIDGGYLHLVVNNEYKFIESSNVIGKIRGSTEPDDWVIYGNHRDSWVYGAVDPSSGTACMMEMTRVLGGMMKQGWRPKRTILFGSWGAEEFGLIGSVEWAQENAQLLTERAVAYINVDIAVFANTTFHARASPVITNLLADAAKRVPDPVDNSKTVLDTWMRYYPNPTESDLPNVRRLYSGSDYAYFYHGLGVTSADLSYRGDPDDPRTQISPYPTYHTAYDTFDYVDRFIDPGFYAHTAVCKVAGSALLIAADSLIIPVDPRSMAIYVQNQITATKNEYSDVYGDEKIGYLEEAGQSLTDAANSLMTYIDTELNRQNLADISAVNRRLLMFEKSFIEPLALPGELNYKHIIGAPHSGGDSGSFPSIDGFLYGVNTPSSDVQKQAEQQLAMITYRILNAASLLIID